jgi:hypothetical protein
VTEEMWVLVSVGLFTAGSLVVYIWWEIIRDNHPR